MSNCEVHIMRETKGLRTVNDNKGAVIAIQKEWVCQEYVEDIRY